MSIGKRVTKAWQELMNGDPEGALVQICTAIEKTAKLEGKRKAGGYKRFVDENMPIITSVGVGVALKAIKLGGYHHPELRPAPDGTVPLQDIIYHVIRCRLYHDAGLPADLEITEDRIGVENGHLLMPKHLVTGMVLAVVAAPINKKERTDPTFFVIAKRITFYLDQVWGRRDLPTR
jgi:hypothetical protein